MKRSPRSFQTARRCGLAFLALAFGSIPLMSSALPDEPGTEKPGAEKKLDVDFKTASGMLCAAELSLTGKPFFDGFFRRGWPTNKATKGLLLEDAQGAAEDTLATLMGSEIGVPLTSSAYLAEMLTSKEHRGGRPWRSTKDVLDTKIEEFTELAGLAKAPTFDPILFEFDAAKPTYKADFVPEALGVQPWISTSIDKSRLTMETIAAGLYAQALYARQQILEQSHGAGDRPTDRNFGSSPERAFLALVSLQNAVCKAEELRQRCILEGDKVGAFKAISTYDLRSTRAILPHRLAVSTGRGYSLDKDPEVAKSWLLDQALTLLGCTEIMKVMLLGQEGIKLEGDLQKRIGKIFSKQRFKGTEDICIAPEAFEGVADLALFIVVNLQRLHFDPDRRTFRSRSTDNPDLERVQLLTAYDCGMTMLALAEFLKVSQVAVDTLTQRSNAIKARLLNKRKYGGTCLRFALSWLRVKVKDRKGLFDRYNIVNGNELDKKLSAESLGAIIRGLLSLDGLPEKDLPIEDQNSALVLAGELMQSVEQDLWNDDLKLYVGRRLTVSPSEAKPLAVPTAGQVAMIGALRELAVKRNDIRYFIRIKELIASLKSRGFIYAETIRGGETATDSDSDGVPGPVKDRRAPVLLPQVLVTSAK